MSREGAPGSRRLTFSGRTPDTRALTLRLADVKAAQYNEMIERLKRNGVTITDELMADVRWVIVASVQSVEAIMTEDERARTSAALAAKKRAVQETFHVPRRFGHS